MIYRVIGLMSGSSLDGLDIVFAEFQENAGVWEHEILHADCYPYEPEWVERLKNAVTLTALDYQLLHADYGHYLGKRVNQFIREHQLEFKSSLVASHGHTTFHKPQLLMTAQLGDGAAIAAETRLPVVSDLRAMDVALGGQGAPIVPIGEKMLLSGHDFFLNLGGIANISAAREPYIAFDICPANRVLNLIVNEAGKEFDQAGQMASRGKINTGLLSLLNDLPYYKQPHPKSLANDFGTGTIYPMMHESGTSIEDRLRTYCEHIVMQVKAGLAMLLKQEHMEKNAGMKMLTTGGGAFNDFLVGRLQEELKTLDIEVVIPNENLIKYKEALIMGFIGILRWRQEFNVLSSVTGAARDSIGGAIWMGGD
jgi:anhydro-N-acetylmuramic acid kinase